MFDPHTLSIYIAVCVASTFVVLLPWFFWARRHRDRSGAFLTVAVFLACAKLIVMVPTVMLWAVGKFSSAAPLWVLSVPFFVDFYLMYQVGRVFIVRESE